jgi:hypothetical protein
VSTAKFTIVKGEPDPNSGGLDTLHDAKLAAEEDAPAQNFFFEAGTKGGQVMIDLGRVLEIEQVNTYSWHPGTRGPQVYKLYANDRLDSESKLEPGSVVSEKNGWKEIAKVDTRPAQGEGGGQYGVSISDSQGTLGKFRVLLFDIECTETNDAFGNTFYSEVDVVERNGAPPLSIAGGSAGSGPCQETLSAGDGAYQITLDTCETPDLTQWATNQLAPMAQEWYPKLVKLLPSDGYEAPKKFSISFSADMKGVAATGGTRIRCAAEWFRHNLKGEAVGAVFHELVHVVQSYGRARRTNPNATRPPGWLVEGIPDYVRWFIYEPQSHGADIVWMRGRRNLKLQYDAGYRVSANFLNWVTEKHAADIVPRLNAALREGKDSSDIWKQQTGHTVEELGEEWKRETEEKLKTAS